ncbi:nuclear transport factor 2 family protein [Kitasatospora sp. NBC_01266]|uniref:nuclear transport factor 2 family protein n=1 Tax=Kitasatospora sp. NBC_01266 TaxID=2903572 RepID=UPI002E35757D|nr:nuclear transport factor 2 family protein [Kitasatospora sp. NBC_01266]
MSELSEKTTLAETFRTALQSADWPLLRSLLTEDCHWTLPGDNRISGQVRGADAVIERLRLIAGYGVHFDFQRTLFSRDNLALSLHNTAERDGRVLDEHLATVCLLDGGRIRAIETYLSDVPGMNAFFV